jgi:MerR family mercuric resistance operon transcriptional regulator
MIKAVDSLTIGTFAKAAGVHVETIRFYQRKGLLAEPAKPLGGIRRYGEKDVARVRFIKSAQGLGFSLEETAQLLRLDDGAQCAEAAALALDRLADVRTKIAGLVRMEDVLSQLVRECRRSESAVSCPLIASLGGSDGIS